MAGLASLTIVSIWRLPGAWALLASLTIGRIGAANTYNGVIWVSCRGSCSIEHCAAVHGVAGITYDCENLTVPSRTIGDNVALLPWELQH
eukprot:5011039-Lingulodinium_polyedra.AAC.3